MKSLRKALPLTLLLTVLLLLVSCEQKSSTGSGGDTTPGTIQSVSVTVADVNLYALTDSSATTEVTATVIDTSGMAVSGVTVTFASSLTGTSVSPQDPAVTDENGQITAIFSSQGHFGLATISASVNSGGQTITGTVNVGVWPLTGLATDITLSLSPDVLYLAEGTEDTVDVTIRVYDSLHVGIQYMQVTVTSTLGVIAVPNLTDGTGSVTTQIVTNEAYGVGYVTASVHTALPDTGSELNSVTGPGTWPNYKTGTVLVSGLGYPEGSTPAEPQPDDIFTISDSDTFWVYPIGLQLDTLIISASPGILTVAPDTVSSAAVTATVLDASNNGVPGVPVSFATDLGLIASNSSVTDAYGRKTVTFYTLENQYGTAHVWAVVGGLIPDTTEIIINGALADSGILMIDTDTRLIYADYGITFANITALLKDGTNQVIQGANIIFTSTYGTIPSPVPTDNLGQAHATFQALGSSSSPDSAVVTAIYAPLNLQASVNIMVAPARQVDHIVLSVASSSVTANGLDSTRVDATVYLENNELAPEGTEISFYVGGDNLGQFPNPDTTVGSGGMARMTYYAGNSTGVDSLYAIVDNTFSNIVPVQLVAGPPGLMDLVITPSSLPVNSLVLAIVTATIRDSSENLVEDGWGVLFTTTLGTIFPPEALTINGVATSYLSSSTQAGNAWVKAQVGLFVDSALASFMPLTPAYISLTADCTFITVQGAGSNNQTGIHAYVRDAANNLVGNDVWVYFSIIGGLPGGGVNLNNQGLSDSAMTNGGIATVVLNAGTTMGPVQIMAQTFADSAHLIPITAQQTLVNITAGPPENINVNIQSDEPESGGGDIWRVEVSALVTDTLGHEVPDGIGISFSLEPLGIAQIQNEATTGNANWNGDSYPGVAFTTLTYHSNEIFDSVTVYAYTMVGFDTVSGFIGYLLPLDANAELDLQLIPINWDFSEPPPPYAPYTPARVDARAFLVDGHGQTINNAMIIFYSTLGLFYLNQNGTNYSNEKITGPAGVPPSPNGYAYIWWITTESQALPPPQTTNTGVVHAQVARFPNVVSENVTFTFYQ